MYITVVIHPSSPEPMVSECGPDSAYYGSPCRDDMDLCGTYLETSVDKYFHRNGSSHAAPIIMYCWVEAIHALVDG